MAKTLIIIILTLIFIILLWLIVRKVTTGALA